MKNIIIAYILGMIAGLAIGFIVGDSRPTQIVEERNILTIETSKYTYIDGNSGKWDVTVDKEK